jgi:endonuclease-3 related protein
VSRRSEPHISPIPQIGTGEILGSPECGDDVGARVRKALATLEHTYGDELWHWMPEHAQPIDIIVGAILVQHTTWVNANRALDSLREAGALEVRALASRPESESAALVRVSGTPSIKARRLRAAATMIEDAGGLDAFLALPLDSMRPLLLATHGIGPETADAIALYAARNRTFVIDAYTQRIFTRLGLEPAPAAGYAAWQRHFEDALPDEDVEAFQRYHGYIVHHAKALCRVKPTCAPCPLLDRCRHRQSLLI